MRGVGPAESVAHSLELFEQVESRLRVFRRMPNTGRGAVAGAGRGGSASPALEPDGSAAPLHVEADSLPREADRLLLARFAPACILVNQALTILQFRGQRGPAVEPAGGAPSFDLRRAVARSYSSRSFRPLRRPATAAWQPAGIARLDEREISIEVIPLAGSAGGQAFLILFDDGSRPAVDRRMPAAANALPESEKDRRSRATRARSRGHA